jgi:hypothetical protein
MVECASALRRRYTASADLDVRWTRRRLARCASVFAFAGFAVAGVAALGAAWVAGGLGDDSTGRATALAAGQPASPARAG